MGSDGTLFLSVAEFDGPRDIPSLLKRALGEPGQVFIGVTLSKKETVAAVAGVENAYAEVAAYAAGRRQARRKGRR
jgi:hypothetical protein